jgi:hypothetical protein
MKLNELAATSPTKQAAKVFESYFGNKLKFDSITAVQARGMLKRVRTMIAEHRRTPEFHKREATLMSSRNATIEDFEYVMGLFRDKKIQENPFISQRFHSCFALLVYDGINIVLDYPKLSFFEGIDWVY